MKLATKSALTTAAITAMIGMTTVSAHADTNKAEMEKCYGVVEAGKNDCASAGNNSCAGTSKIDGDPAAWVMVPAGLCDKLVGGETEPSKEG